MSLDFPGMLVSTEWLAPRLGVPDLRVFDATKFLPNEPRDALLDYEHGHIPGARFFDIDLFADQETDLPHMVPTQGRFARLAGESGIGNGSAVVFYDQRGQSSAARGWWLLRLFGHDRVALLDGGWPAWQRMGGPIETGIPAPAAPAVFTPRPRARLLAGLGDVAAAAADGALILDARPAARFSGDAPEPRPGLARGHIPCSVSLPFTALLDENACFLPRESLRARFKEAGAGDSRRVITTCGTGVTASILAFGLSHAGLCDAAVYDGSWAEWGSLDDTPKETGP
jgi:thiosulfate/3-mercaptopyruvate sulfurtransferase